MTHLRTESDLLRSVAEVQRVFSIAKYVFPVNRRSMSPQLFEVLVFFKLDERFWDANLVSKAISCTRSERTKAWMRGHDVHDKDLAE